MRPPTAEVKSAAEMNIQPDRAAILVFRATTPLQAARQVNAVVRHFRGPDAPLVGYGRGKEDANDFSGGNR
jgi:hypothetical protein